MVLILLEVFDILGQKGLSLGCPIVTYRHVCQDGLGGLDTISTNKNESDQMVFNLNASPGQYYMPWSWLRLVI